MTRTLLVAACLLTASVELAGVAFSGQMQSLVATLIRQRSGSTVCVQVSPNACVAAKSEGTSTSSCGAAAERSGCADGFVAVTVADGRNP